MSLDKSQEKQENMCCDNEQRYLMVSTQDEQSFISINSVKAHGRTHSFKPCLWPFLHKRGRVELMQHKTAATKPKILTIWPCTESPLVLC